MAYTIPKAQQRYELLAGEVRWLARNPRYNLLIAQLPTMSRAFKDPNVKLAEIFWEAYNYVAIDDNSETGLLDSGLRGTPAKFLGVRDREHPPAFNYDLRTQQVRLARDILGAIAFELFFPSLAQPVAFVSAISDGDLEYSKSDRVVSPKANPTLAKPRFQIDGKEEVSAFYNAVYGRLLAAKVYWLNHPNESEKPFWTNDRESLESMNSRGLEHFILDGGSKSIFFTDISVQAFFAAYWAVNYTSEIDLDQVLKSVPDPLFDRNEVYREFWTMAAEMPPKHVCKKRWYELFAPLYDCTRSRCLQRREGIAIRSTELIYRTWDRMLGTPACDVFQNEFKKIVLGNSGPKKQKTAMAMISSHRLLPLCERPDRGDSGELRTNRRDSKETSFKLPPFRLSKFCVQYREFDLFDRNRILRLRHKNPEIFYDIRSDLRERNDWQKEAAKELSWYDCWCFVKWIGTFEMIGGRSYQAIMPSENQWEYAMQADGKVHIPPDEEFQDFRGKKCWSIERSFNSWGFWESHCCYQWCSDLCDRDCEYVDSNSMAPSPVMNGYRVLRGDYDSYGLDVRERSVERRKAAHPQMRETYNDYSEIGFRLAAIPIDPNG